MTTVLLGGPADDPALEVGSRLTARLQAIADAPCCVAVTWDAHFRGAYAYRVAYGAWRAIHFVTGDLLAEAISLDVVATLLFERVTDRGRDARKQRELREGQ